VREGWEAGGGVCERLLVPRYASELLLVPARCAR